MMNIFNADMTMAGGLRNLALQRMQEAMLAQIKKETDVDIEKYQAQFDDLQNQAQDYRVAKGRISVVGLHLQSNLENLAAIKETLFDMKVVVEDAATTTDIEYMAKKFDEGLRDVNKKANGLARGFNLIGGSEQTVWTDPTMEYRQDYDGHRATIQGQYAGSDFYISDTGGQTWVPDWGSVSLERYTDFVHDEQTDTDLYSMLGNVQVDSYDSGTGAVAFTVYPGDATKEASYSGTVTKGGLGVMPTMFYDDLTTASGRTTAAAAVEAAREEVAALEAKLNTEYAKLGAYENQLQVIIDDYNDRSVKAARDGLMAQAESQFALQTRYQGMVANLQSIAAMQGNTGQIFKGALRGNKLAGVMVDQTA